MNLIQPNCRVQFTAQDIDFVLRILGKNSHSGNFLTQLLADEPSRDAILDDPALYRALLETPACLQVSAHFYFYVMVRNVLRTADLDDRQLADYVAEILCAYSETTRANYLVAGQAKPLDYFFEMMEAMHAASEREAFGLSLHIGHNALFMAGLFPERIRSRAELRGFPDLSYFEEMGRSYYRAAGNHRLARKYNLAHILSTLAECFRTVRRALNEMSERLFSLGDGAMNLPVIAVS